MCKRNWVLCFEECGEGTKYHVRDAALDRLLSTSLCGIELDGVATRTIKFEDELDDKEMCQTCKTRGIARGMEEEND